MSLILQPLLSTAGDDVEPFGGVPLAELDDVIDLARYETMGWKPRLVELMRSGMPLAHGGAFLQDTRPPFNRAAYPSVTLAATSKMLVPSSPNTLVQPTDWFPGKKWMVRSFGQMTTAATPGNLTIEIRASTADNAGTLLATSAALTLIASQTTLTWRSEFRCECWDTGSGGASGALLATGVFECNTAVIAAGQAMIPASAIAAATVDLSGPIGISLQWKRSGSTAETAQVFSQEFSGLT